MFKKGDTVVYGSNGTCIIEGTEKKKIGKEVYEYFCLKPVLQDNNLIYVPVKNESLMSKIKKTLGFNELCELISGSGDIEPNWIADETQRRDTYKNILSSGDRKGIIGLTKALYNEKTRRKELGKKLRSNDEILLKRAVNYLLSEFSTAVEVDYYQVIPLIMNEISPSDLKVKE